MPCLSCLGPTSLLDKRPRGSETGLSDWARRNRAQSCPQTGAQSRRWLGSGPSAILALSGRKAEVFWVVDRICPAAQALNSRQLHLCYDLWLSLQAHFWTPHITGETRSPQCPRFVLQVLYICSDIGTKI